MASIRIQNVEGNNGFIVYVYGDDFDAEKTFVFEKAYKAKKLVTQFFQELEAQQNGEVLK